MVLTAAVLAFVNTASLVSLSGRLDGSLGSPGLDLEVTPDPDAATSTGISGTPIVSVAASLQWQWSVVGIVGAGALAGLLGWLLARRMLRPIEHITNTTKSLGARNLHERIGLDGPDDEVRRLATTIDELLNRLEASFTSQRRFIAHASHELRTPLTVQRAVLQVGLGSDLHHPDVIAVRDQLLVQNRRTEALVESLLILAEAERGLDGSQDIVNVAASAAEILDDTAADADHTGVVVVRDIDATVHVRAESILLQQLIRNLIVNAVEYNRPGGRVWIVAEAHGLIVENCGDTLSADTVATFTEPFRRGAHPAGTNSHHGLGLSIVAAIADAHGWSLSVMPRDGGGLRVSVRWDGDTATVPLV